MAGSEEVIEHFWAVAEDGSQFQILVYAPILSGDSPGQAPPAIKRGNLLRTSNGFDVNRLDDDTYEIVDLGLKVKRIR